MTLNPKAGDVVHVRMRVVRVDPGDERLKYELVPMHWNNTEAGFGSWFTPEALVAVEDRPLAVGDQVESCRNKNGDRKGVIKAIVAGKAWVHWPNLDCDTVWDLDALKRVA